MTRTTSYTFKLNTTTVKRVEDNAILGLITMGYDINNRAKGKAPYLSGNLVQSIRVDVSEEKMGTIWVIAGGTANGYKILYAKRREFENNAHPDKKYYMEKSFDEIVRNYVKYFTGVTR